MSIDVSIIIPVYNRPMLVQEAVASAIRESRGFTHEIIVVDDASTDETWDVVQSLEGVRALRMETNSRQCAARNRGLAVATGRYVKFLDSDDVLVAGHLQRELDAAKSTNADIVASGWREDGVDYPAPVFTSIIDDVLAGSSVPTSAALYVRHPEWRWDPSMPLLDDWDYFVNAALRATKIATLEGSAYEWRTHAGARVTNASMLVLARTHHAILHKIEARLREQNELTESRRKRLAQYFYKELRVLSLHDRAEFDAALAHIFELDADFTPRDEERQWWMRIAARVAGTRNAVLLHSAIKRIVKGS
ncbi:MAG TPA: glycosyltransferase [Thermoanaerobaculia bacterium]